jgi:hypothetical protein
MPFCSLPFHVSSFFFLPCENLDVDSPLVIVLWLLLALKGHDIGHLLIRLVSLRRIVLCAP